MAKNAVTDWSTNDSLNTDIGSTNIAEGCAPSGINDAIRKIMAQVATYISGALFGGAVSIKPAAADGSLLLYSSGTLAANLRASAGAGVYASDAHVFRNLSEGVTYASFTAAATSLLGTNVQLLPQAGGVYSAGNHGVQGALALGGAALGGLNGQIQFNRSDGAANVLNIALATGPNTFAFNNSDTSGVYSFRFNGTEKLRLTSAIVSSPSPILSSLSVKAGLSGVGAGSIQIAQGDATRTGYLEFLNSAGGSIGSIQQTIGGAISYLNGAGGGHSFQGGGLSVTAGNVGVRAAGAGGVVVTAGSATVTGNLVMTDAAGSTIASIGGQAIGQPTVLANGAGHVFTGGPAFFGSYVQASGLVDGTTPGPGTTGGLRTRGSGAGGAAILQFTNFESTNEWVSVIADPSGNKLTFVVGHVPVLSIDSSGNVRVAGSITPNVAP